MELVSQHPPGAYTAIAMVLTVTPVLHLHPCGREFESCDTPALTTAAETRKQPRCPTKVLKAKPCHRSATIPLCFTRPRL